ncbi:unnamed protein product [Musa acuminata subsp. burmannicoides]
MYEYQMCSSTFETRVLCHLKKTSYQPISGGKFMKSVESTFTEAATETLTGGSSFVGQKRNRENLLLSSAAHLRSHADAGVWLHIPAENCSPTSHHLQPRWCNSLYRHPS